jgi:hypothetical protein
MEKGTLVQHKNVSLLARVEGVDPTDNRKVIIKALTDPQPFSCFKDKLINLGN